MENVISGFNEKRARATGLSNVAGLNETPASDRVAIGFFGRRNVGKSSVVNAVTGQDLAVVSDVKGTTTDPVQKAMELLPLGPVLIIDTPGIDDEGALGALRVQRTRAVLNKTDVAVLVVDASEGVTPVDRELIALFKAKGVGSVVAWNKSDLLGPEGTDVPIGPDEDGLYISALTGEGVNALKERIATLAVTDDLKNRIVGDLLAPADLVVLVVPVDSAAPKGRLILPQQQTIRDILESDATAVVVKEDGLKEVLSRLGARPRLVITDSQAFDRVSKDTSGDVPLTSFSILFARYKGDLAQNVRGVRALDALKDGDKVLICEGCTHHRQCDDIGTVKLPKWIRAFTSADPVFTFTSGGDFPHDLSDYALIVHCGGCMLNEREMKYRLARAADAGVPMTNYGVLIAHVHGILARSLAPFPDLLDNLNKKDKNFLQMRQ
jgi:[FeFe] hydrogenase H-cluster maturation GTPase HydF